MRHFNLRSRASEPRCQLKFWLAVARTSAFLLIFLNATCVNGNELESDSLRFAVMTFVHETCTFCPGGDTTLEDWQRAGPSNVGDEVLSATPYTRGFAKVIQDFWPDDIELIGLTSPIEPHGGSSHSWNTKEVFDHSMDRMIADLRGSLPVDGVYLALHGAMAVRDIARPEAEMARRIREVVGPDVPIVATFDLHGNEDGEFLKWADMAFTTKRYPHYDSGLQGARAAHALIRIARGTYMPTTATRKPPILTPTVLQWSGQSPVSNIMERARRWEARHDDVFVNVFLGFPWSDVVDAGATVQVMTHDNQELAERIADDMQEYVWRVWEDFFNIDLATPSAAVETVREVARKNNRVVLADYSDRSGDATHILTEVVAQQASNVIIGTIRDEAVIASMLQNNVQAGDSFNEEIGGFAGLASGKPVLVNGVVAYFGPGLDFDEIAVVRFGINNAVLVTPALKQIMYPADLNIGDVDYRNFETFVLKSRVHFRRGFDETGFSRSIILVDAPGPYIGTVHLDQLQYKNIDNTKFYSGPAAKR
jgi:microcystin degradation protein MlrC